MLKRLLDDISPEWQASSFLHSVPPTRRSSPHINPLETSTAAVTGAQLPASDSSSLNQPTYQALESSNTLFTGAPSHPPSDQIWDGSALQPNLFFGLDDPITAAFHQPATPDPLGTLNADDFW